MGISTQETHPESLGPIHPGEILQKEFLIPLGISQYRLAKDLGITPIRVSEIVRGKRGITAETGLLLSKYFGMSEGFFLGLQEEYELRRAKRDSRVHRALARVKARQKVGYTPLGHNLRKPPNR